MLNLVDYIGTLDLFRDSKGPNMEQAMTIWTKLGNIAGFDEKQLRKAIRERNLKASKKLVGCGWYRCILHKQDTEKVMYWCKGCQKVIYCSVECQERCVCASVVAVDELTGPW